MRLKEVIYNGKRSLVIYMTEQEKEELNKFLADLNFKYDTIVTFVSGNKDMKSALNQIVHFKVENSD